MEIDCSPESLSIKEINGYEELQSCTICSRQYCNGNRHNKQNPFLYPSCNTCGIELCDLIELLENKSLRDQQTCEICSHQYTTSLELNIHFATHFYRSYKKYESKFYCINCIYDRDEEHLEESDVKNELSNDSEQHNESENSKNHTKTTTQTHYTVTKTISNSDVFFIADINDDSTNHHFEEVHTSLSEEYMETNHLMMMAEKRITEKRFGCKKCKKKYGTLLELSFHQSETHNPEKQVPRVFKCRICDETFSESNGRYNHEKNVHRETNTNLFYCPQGCFSSKCIASVSNHMLIHSNEFPFICDICGKSFRRLSYLHGHYVSHNEENSYSCTLCSKVFKTKYGRNKHEKYFHSDQKRYQCPFCDRKFKEHSDCRRHKWTHGGYEKKFQCMVCEMKFFENKTLKHHMRVHMKAEKKKRRASTKKKDIDYESWLK